MKESYVNLQRILRFLINKCCQIFYLYLSENGVNVCSSIDIDFECEIHKVDVNSFYCSNYRFIGNEIKETKKKD